MKKILLISLGIIALTVNAAETSAPIQELTEDGVPTEAFRKTFVWFSHTYVDPNNPDERMYMNSPTFRIPYRVHPTITAEQFAEYQKNGKIPYYISVSLRRNTTIMVWDGIVHFVIQDEKGKVLVRESVPLDKLDSPGGWNAAPVGYWGELPRPGKYTLTMWTKRESGVVFGGTHKVDLAWPLDKPQQILELTKDGIPTDESQATFHRFGSAYHYDPANPDAIMFFNLQNFAVPYGSDSATSISEAELQEYRENGKIPFYFVMSLTSLGNNKNTRVDPEAPVNFVILDKDLKVIIQDAVPLEKQLNSSVRDASYRAYYGGELPKEGSYTLILWADMECGVIFGTRKGAYFALPTLPPEQDNGNKVANFVETDNHPSLHLVTITTERRPLKQPTFDCAALIRRIQEDQEGDSGIKRGYISALESYQETGKLARSYEEGTSNEGCFHLRSAAELGYFDIVEDLLAAGVNINAGNRIGETPLIGVAKNGHLDSVKMLIAAGANIDQTDDAGRSALSFAARNGHLDIVKTLIAAGADVKTVTALNAAVTEKQTAIIKVLLAAGADVTNGMALHNAASYGELEALEMLLAAGAGANINAQRTDGQTALMLAFVGWGDRDAKIFALIAAGADVNLQDKDGNTALRYAVTAGHVYHKKREIIKALLEAGAYTEVQDNIGRTALIVATDQANIYTEFIEELLAVGANVNTRDKGGRTPLICALKNSGVGRVKIRTAEALIAAGADVNAKDNDGVTALEYVKRTEIITPDSKNHIGKLSVDQSIKLIDLLSNAAAKE